LVKIGTEWVKIGTELGRIGQNRNRIGQIDQNQNDLEQIYGKYRIRNKVPIIGTSGNPAINSLWFVGWSYIN